MLSELNSWYSLDISLQSAYRSFRMLASETRPSRKFSTKNLLQGVTQTYQAIFHLLDTSRDESISARGGVKQNTPRPGQPGGSPPLSGIFLNFDFFCRRLYFQTGFSVLQPLEQSAVNQHLQSSEYFLRYWSFAQLPSATEAVCDAFSRS